MPTGPNKLNERLLAEIAAAMREGNSRSASQMAERALALGVHHPLPYQARAVHLDISGRGEEALADFFTAQAMNPNDPMVANGVAICLGRMGRIKEAVEQFNLALKLDPNLVSTHLHMGSMLEMHGQFGLARDAYRKAAKLAPQIAAGWVGVASTAQAIGDWSEAWTAATRALSIDPRQSRADLVLAAAEFQSASFEAAARRLRSALASREPVLRSLRIAMMGLLADVLDRQGNTADAFAFYAAANQERRSDNSSRRSTLDMNALVRNLTAFLDRTYPHEWLLTRGGEAMEGGAKQHLFLLGFPRSGTTLLEQVLAAHPSVTTLEESDVLDSAAQKYLCDPEGLRQLSTLQGNELEIERKEYWSRVRSHGAELRGKVFVDKLPLNTIKLPLIAKLFPAAKVIFVQRDPRDVVFSCFRRHLPVNASTIEFLTLAACAHFYDSVMTLGEICRNRLPLSFFIVRHEDLVRDFDGEMVRMCAFAGIEWVDCLRDFARISGQRDIRSISAQQVRQGLNSNGEGQWRRYGSQLNPILPVLAPWVEKFGYNPE